MSKINLYSNKQRWKIFLMVVALLLVGASLVVSNRIVQRVGKQEQLRATQWADALKTRVELMQFTNLTFAKLREKEKEKMEFWVEATKELSNPASFDFIPEFPMKIVKGNDDIPVVLLDSDRQISGHRNVELDTNFFKEKYPSSTAKEITSFMEDSLRILAQAWSAKNPSFTIEVFEGLFMTYVYDDSKTITSLEQQRDSLIQSFNQELVNNDGLVPVVLINKHNREVVGSNLENYSNDEISVDLQHFIQTNDSLIIDYKNGQQSVLYFAESPELKQLQYYPYIQFFITGLIALIGYLVFSTFRKAEQNQVWAGMAKETAHQLGTPLSSLMAWTELLAAQGVDPMITQEMQKDLTRLEDVTDRFSKIGSGAKLEDLPLGETVSNVINYLRPRISDKVQFELDLDESVHAKHNPALLGWVIENIVKNAVDAMEAKGAIFVQVKYTPEWAQIDISDTGKGMTKKQMKAIFKPGYTTKVRGWGLGLSLVKRIIADYHKGRVFVASSQINEGSTFRIRLPIS